MGWLPDEWPQTPSGRLAAVQARLEAGQITPAEARRLLDDVDAPWDLYFGLDRDAVPRRFNTPPLTRWQRARWRVACWVRNVAEQIAGRLEP